MKVKLNVAKWAILVLAVIAVIFAFRFSTSLLENNQVGYYQVKQAWPSGNMTVRNSPGLYGQWMGQLFTYKKSNELNLSADELDGGRGAATQAVRVLFPDGHADVSLVIQYKLPTDEKNRLKLQEEYSSAAAVQSLFRQQTIAALKNTATLFNSGDAYADKRSDFIGAFRAQLMDGLYIPQVTTVTVKNSDGSTRTEKRYSIKLSKATDSTEAVPLIQPGTESVIGKLGFEILAVAVKGMPFDDKLMALIDSKKEAQLSEQEAKTARAKGEVGIAAERALQEKAKIQAVTIAQKERDVEILTADKEKVVAVTKATKEFEMMELAAKTAVENAKKIRAEGEAKAAANLALVKAGLTPLERAQIDKETAIGVAREMAKLKFPTTMVFGGGGEGNSPMNPFDAVGLQAFIDIGKGMSKTK